MRLISMSVWKTHVSMAPSARTPLAATSAIASQATLAATVRLILTTASPVSPYPTRFPHSEFFLSCFFHDAYGTTPTCVSPRPVQQWWGLQRRHRCIYMHLPPGIPWSRMWGGHQWVWKQSVQERSQLHGLREQLHLHVPAWFQWHSLRDQHTRLHWEVKPNLHLLFFLQDQLSQVLMCKSQPLHTYCLHCFTYNGQLS